MKNISNNGNSIKYIIGSSTRRNRVLLVEYRLRVAVEVVTVVITHIKFKLKDCHSSIIIFTAIVKV